MWFNYCHLLCCNLWTDNKLFKYIFTGEIHCQFFLVTEIMKSQSISPFRGCNMSSNLEQLFYFIIFIYNVTILSFSLTNEKECLKISESKDLIFFGYIFEKEFYLVYQNVIVLKIVIETIYNLYMFSKLNWLLKFNQASLQSGC